METTTTTETQAQSAASANLITLTANAVKEIKQIFAKKNMPPTTAVRLQVKGGGCSGFSYNLDFFDGSQADPRDRVMEQDGVKLVCDNKSLLYLKGMTVDFSDTLFMRQFVFKNPNAKSTCGCGTSFTV